MSNQVNWMEMLQRGEKLSRRTFLQRSTLSLAVLGSGAMLLQACEEIDEEGESGAGSTGDDSTSSDDLADDVSGDSGDIEADDSDADTEDDGESEGSDGQTGGTLVYARTADLIGLDPHLTGGAPFMRTNRLFYNGLIRLDEDVAVIPDLAESWEIDEDGVLITFNLHQGVMWHPPVSRELVAEDIEYSFSRMREERAGEGSLGVIDYAEPVDDYTVELHLTAPNSGLLASMAELSSAAIINRETVEEHGDLRTVNAVGTGPFIVEGWEPEEEMRLSRNPDYFMDDRPYLDEIIIRIIPEESNIVAALRTGDVHLTILEDNVNYELLADDPNLTSYRSPGIGYDYMCINHDVEPLGIREVRQAMSWAIDRSAIINAATQYAELTAPLPPGMVEWALPESEWQHYYERDVDRARELLAEAGYEDGFEVELLTIPTLPTMGASAEVIQANLADIGIEVSIQSQEFGTWLERFNAKDFELTMNLISGFADPEGMLYRLFHSQAENPNNWSNEEADELLERGRLSIDPDERKEAYDQAQLIMLEDAVQIWAFTPEVIAFANNSVQGWSAQPRRVLDNLDQVRLEQ